MGGVGKPMIRQLTLFLCAAVPAFAQPTAVPPPHAVAPVVPLPSRPSQLPPGTQTSGLSVEECRNLLEIYDNLTDQDKAFLAQQVTSCRQQLSGNASGAGPSAPIGPNVGTMVRHLP